MSVSYESVKRAIDRWDPVGLLSSHAPPDEYDGESKEIFAALQKNPDMGSGDLTKLIHEVFTKAFGDDVFKKTPSDCSEVAEKILGELKRNDFL